MLCRLQSDADPNRPHKGFGYAEFADSSAAEQARRTLNGRMVGGRPLKIAKPGNEGVRSAADSAGGLAPQVLKAHNALTQYERWNLVAEMRNVARTNPEMARKLLKEAAPLACATLMAMDSLQMLQGAGGQAAGQSAAPNTFSAPGMPSSAPAPRGGLLGAPTPAGMPVLRDTAAGGPGAMPAPAAASGNTSDMAATLQSVLALTDAQLAGFPAAQRSEMLSLRKAFQLSPAQIALLPPGERESVSQMRAELVTEGVLRA